MKNEKKGKKKRNVFSDVACRSQGEPEFLRTATVDGDIRFKESALKGQILMGYFGLEDK